MNLAAFEDLIDRHGGDLDTWPAALRREAAAFAAASTAASKALDAMRAAEHVLAATRVTGAAASGEAFAASAMRHRQHRASSRLAVRTGWGAAAAAMLVLGVAVGNLAPRQHDDSPERLMALSLDSGGATDVD